MVRRSSIFPSLIATVVATLWLVAAPLPVAASCNPGRDNVDFAGYAGTQGAASGVSDVSSSIREYVPYVTSGSEVTQWVMLNNGGTEWAQVGWWQDVTTHYTFEQHTDNSGHWYTNWWSANGNGYNGYEVSFNSTTHVFGFYRQRVDPDLLDSAMEPELLPAVWRDAPKVGPDAGWIQQPQRLHVREVQLHDGRDDRRGHQQQHLLRGQQGRGGQLRDLGQGVLIMNTTKRRIAVVVAGVALTAALTTQVVFSQPPPLLTANEAAQLGLEMQPLPAADAGAQTPVDAKAAIERAQLALRTTDNPVEIHHVLTRQFGDSPERSAFVLVFAGGGSIPGGPAGSNLHPVSYRGVVVDDQSGDVLRIFAAGGI